MDNACYPWIILVPEREYVTDITDLSIAGRALLMEETVEVSRLLKDLYHPDKVNVAMLGNIVPQLHMHVVARFKNDSSWPDPVWGKEKPRKYYSDEQKEQTVRKLLAGLALVPSFTSASIYQ